MSIPLVPLSESILAWGSDLQVWNTVAAVLFAGFFLLLMVLDFSFLSIGGNIAREKAQAGLLMLLFAILCLIFGLYFLAPFFTMLFIGVTIWVIYSIGKAIKLAFFDN